MTIIDKTYLRGHLTKVKRIQRSRDSVVSRFGEAAAAYGHAHISLADLRTVVKADRLVIHSRTSVL